MKILGNHVQSSACFACCQELYYFIFIFYQVQNWINLKKFNDKKFDNLSEYGKLIIKLFF